MNKEEQEFENIIDSLYQTYRVSYADRLLNSYKVIKKHIEEIYYE